MTQVYKLNYGCSKKRLNDLIHKGLEYEKEHGIDEKEVLKVRKDQQIEELKELLEHERLNYAQLESDYKKVNELGLEPSYIKQVIKENEELNKQLENAVVPKFKIGQEVWWIDTRVNSFNEQKYKIESYLIDSIVITKEQFRYYGDDGLWLDNEELFATKEEAEAKLKELQDEQV